MVELSLLACNADVEKRILPTAFGGSLLCRDFLMLFLLQLLINMPELTFGKVRVPEFR